MVKSEWWMQIHYWPLSIDQLSNWLLFWEKNGVWNELDIYTMESLILAQDER